MTQHDPSKRRFIKAATYVAPVILTLKVTPTFAATGSGRGNNGVGNYYEGQPPGNPPINDEPPSAPGSPGNRGGGF